MLLSDRPDHRLLQAIQAQGEERTWRAVKTIFDLAGQATALDPAELLNRLGFESNDLDSANFQAMLAVLRTINKLHELGFMEIAPLRPRLVRREADLLAIKDSRRYAVEVFRSGETAHRLANHESRSINLASYIARRVREKLPQVARTMEEHGCPEGIFVVVMDSQPSRALDNASEYLESVITALEEIDDPQSIHILLFTSHDEHVCHPPIT